MERYVQQLADETEQTISTIIDEVNNQHERIETLETEVNDQKERIDTLETTGVTDNYDDEQDGILSHRCLSNTSS